MAKSLEVLFCCVTFFVLTDAAFKKNCKSEVTHSEFGFALIKYIYQSVGKKDYQSCLQECKNHQLCISINFNLLTNQCELNSQSKESRPHRFVPRMHNIYCTNIFFRTPEPVKGMKGLPGKSCLDVLESDEFVGNGTYWIKSNNTGNPTRKICLLDINGVMNEKHDDSESDENSESRDNSEGEDDSEGGEDSESESDDDSERESDDDSEDDDDSKRDDDSEG
ncbi:serrate RNA effector molecule homolog [Actinia tenebrosa]|uniref:Serrate RNA effector molecule homolog n=1 Tax=Actinia tenebrosa TaxID=6105 RepID=A0A6P8H3G7_ACTTE|nr:serrate RNA effector molecule homolog [Actinia tenebrosa]